MWNTSNSNGYLNDGATLGSTKPPCMSPPPSSIQYYKEDILPFQENSNTNSFYIYNINTSHQSNNSSSKTSSLTETVSNILNNEQVTANNREMLDLIYNRTQNQQQEFTNMSNITNNGEFNNTTCLQESDVNAIFIFISNRK